MGGFALSLMCGAGPAALILGLTQDLGLRAVSFLALDPDFRQDDGGGVGGFALSLMCGAGPASVILGLTRDPGLRAGSFVALGSDFRQDDAGWGGWLRLCPDVRCLPFLRHPGLDAGSRVAGGVALGSGS